MDNSIRSFIERNKDKMLDDIKTIIAVRSVKGDAKPGMPYGEGPAAAVKCMEALAKSHGFETKNVDGYVLEVNMNSLPDELGILCHLDVVHEGTGWTTPPYEADIREGRIYGRGSADNKGPAIASLYAMKCVKELNVPLKKNVRLMLGTDEECGSSDLVEYWKRATPPPFCFSPDAAFPVYNIEKGRFAPHFTASFSSSDSMPKIVSINGGNAVNIVPEAAFAEISGISLAEMQKYGEEYTGKTGVTFTFEEKGDAIAIKAAGVSTHASYPAEGNNALTALIALLSNMPFADSEGFNKLKAVAELLPHCDYSGKAVGIDVEDEISGALTCNLGTFEYTDTQIIGGIDIRSPICGNKENVALTMEKSFNEKGFTLDTNEMVLPHYVPEDMPFIKTLLKNYEEVTGMKGECVSMGGGTYVHGMKNSVAFGAAFPDTDTYAHSADEYAVIDELVACVEIFARVIIEMCGE